MAEIFYDADADLALIQGKKVAIVGYGSQGHAHAQNLRDSGVEVVIALKDGSKSTAKAQEDGFEVKNVADATAWADLIMILAPDQHQRAIYADSIKDKLTPGKTLAFAHGFNIRFGYIQPPAGVDVILVAPKAPGHTVRREYVAGGASPTSSPSSRTRRARRGMSPSRTRRRSAEPARASSRRPSRRRPRPTCSVSSRCCAAGCRTSSSTASRRSPRPDTSRRSPTSRVLHELKLIVDLMWEGGIAKQRWSISDTAEYGDYVSGPRVIDPSVKEHMKAVLADIQSGAFAKRFIDDQDAGAPEFLALRAKEAQHPIEATGKELRALFAWKQQDSDYVEGSAAR